MNPDTLWRRTVFATKTNTAASANATAPPEGTEWRVYQFHTGATAGCYVLTAIICSEGQAYRGSESERRAAIRELEALQDAARHDLLNRVRERGRQWLTAQPEFKAAAERMAAAERDVDTATSALPALEAAYARALHHGDGDAAREAEDRLDLARARLATMARRRDAARQTRDAVAARLAAPLEAAIDQAEMAERDEANATIARLRAEVEAELAQRLTEFDLARYRGNTRWRLHCGGIVKQLLAGG
jgi:hypothetical protein